MRRRHLFSALFVLLVFASLTAQVGRPEPGAAARPAIVVLFEGKEIPVPVVAAPNGPLVALGPLAERLGGTLTVDPRGESATLKVEGKEIVVGVGSSITTVGDDIVSLSQPVTRSADGIEVPLDFLRKTYGTLLGFGFDWRADEGRLVIGPRGARELPVAVDVVHLQGVTTVALQFTEMPRYAIEQTTGLVTVKILSDRVAATPVKRLPPDALVEAVDIAPQQIRLRLVGDAKAESYTLDNPFRLVFDVHRAASTLVAPAGPPAGPAAARSGVHIIVIDPGHGGTESGAVGPGGVEEKELTLLLARELRGMLEARLGVRAVLTRDEDANLPLDTRSAIANQNKADLFVSIHLNSSFGTGAHGAETYFLSNRASDSRAARAAAVENLEQAGLGTDSPQELELMLWDLAQSYHMTESQRLAALIQEELNTALQLRDRGVKQAPFRVLVGAAMPAVLVELGFINNPDEEAKLQTPAYRTQLIAALARAIGRYKALAEGVPAAPSEPRVPAVPPAAAPPATPAPAPPPRPVKS